MMRVAYAGHVLMRHSPLLAHALSRVVVLVAFLLAGLPDGALAQATPPPPAPPAEPPEAKPAPPPDAGFRFHGYMRSGFGGNGEGKGQEPFQAPYANAKYRLGNEAETYLETTFAYGMAPDDDPDVLFDTQVTLAYVTPTSQSNDFSTTFSLREAYARARGVWERRPSVEFWAGARYYDRMDLHINDFYFRDPSGFGGGFQGLPVGAHAKFAFAWIGGSKDELDPNGSVPPDQLFRLNKNTFDLRLYDVAAGRGSLAVAAAVSHFNGDDVPTTAAPITLEDNLGGSATLTYIHPFTGGRYRAGLQYGVGSAYDFRSVLTVPMGRTFVPGETVDLGRFWQFRLVNDVMVDQRGPWSMQAISIYQELDNGAATGNRLRWFSLGARPIHRLGRYFSIAGEAGWDYTVQEGREGGSLFKLTLSPQIRPEVKFLSRPSLRAYVTWARWSEAFRGQVAPMTYGNQLGGFAAGVQLESWW